MQFKNGPASSDIEKVKGRKLYRQCWRRFSGGKRRRSSVKSETLMEFKDITRSVRHQLDNWEFLNSFVVWNIVVVQDLHIASRSVKWFCDTGDIESLPLVLSILSILSCVTILYLYFGRFQIGHGVSDRVGESGPLGVLLPYLDIGNGEKIDVTQENIRKNSLRASWFHNPMNEAVIRS